MNERIYQIMHKYGKLTSCDHEKPATVDKLFVEELKIYFSNKNNINK